MHVSTMDMRDERKRPDGGGTVEEARCSLIGYSLMVDFKWLVGAVSAVFARKAAVTLFFEKRGTADCDEQRALERALVARV
jgi:hypothetical protein